MKFWGVFSGCRDIKPTNILYRIDFVWAAGLGKDWEEDALEGPTLELDFMFSDWGLATDDNGSVIERCGTRPYMAPEIGQGPYDKSVDIFALAIMFRETIKPLVVDRPFHVYERAEPSRESPDHVLFEDFVRSVREAAPPDTVCAEFWDFTKCMLSTAPRDRPTIDEVQEIYSRLYIYTADGSPMASALARRGGVMVAGPLLRIGLWESTPDHDNDAMEVDKPTGP